MDALQRSAVSFRRQGSSGLVWDDKFLKELNQQSERQQKEREQTAAAEANSSPTSQQQDQQQHPQDATVNNKPPAVSINPGGAMERSRSNGGGGRGYRTGRVSPAIEPPSPRVSACGFCSAFANKPPTNKYNRTKRSGMPRSRPL